jgi:hypothetical protein
MSKIKYNNRLIYYAAIYQDFHLVSRAVDPGKNRPHLKAIKPDGSTIIWGISLLN